MKKLYLIILTALSTLTVTAQTIGEAFYIYRNDGGFNAFFRDDVDSIAYSHYDLDSLYYDENVTQLVYTPDSLYRIPLAAIDSVSFVTPKNVCKPGVKVIDSLTDYVLYSDSNSFVLSSATPLDLIPMVGEKIVTIERTVVFPNGFAGEVSSIETVEDGVKVVCAETSITELYDVFFGSSRSIDYSRDNLSRRAKTNNSNKITISPGRVPLDLRSTITGQYSLTKELSLSFTPDLAFEIEPIWTVSGFVILTPETGLYASAVCVADYDLKERLGGAGKLTFQKDFSIPIISQDHIPVVAPWLYFYDKVGAFFRADCTIAAQWEWSQHWRQVFVYEYSSKGEQVLKQPSREPRLVDSSRSEEGLLNGTVALGGFAEVGLTLVDKQVDRIAIRGEYGWEAEAQAVLYKRDFENASHSTALYNQMRDCGFAINKFWNASVQVAAGPWGVDWTPLHNKTELWRMSYVPKFSNVKADRNSNKAQVSGYMSVSGNCLKPVEVGMTLVDEEDNQLSSEFEYYPYGLSGYQFDISNISPQKHYTAYPSVRAWDYTMLAEPTCEVEKSEMSVAISDFKVTRSQYNKGAFTHDGTQYDYRFDVAVTATIGDNAEGVADWGYMYQDPFGNPPATISLKAYGNSYTDTRYAYFRNEAKSTCTLYGYVKYVGSDEIVYGEPHDYPLEYGETTCPDANHPHMIDLGLPSGTKWACCNVGSSTPEGKGGYYAWGETIEKTFYDLDSYNYYYDKNGDGYDQSYEYVYLGPDIFGTNYDVATIGWGEPWQMPTHKQCKELIEHTNSEWTAINGVVGRKYVGSNGCSIFLPASGVKYEGELFEGNGYYWSSTHYEEKYTDCPSWAYNLFFNNVESDCTFHLNDLFSGRTIRPVVGGICPDTNHPHMIDLGLPSGTKWACCNIGANKPEECGNYYAWGETDDKNVYNSNTYAHWSDSNGDGNAQPKEFSNIGPDIAATIYDAAKANWGNSWRMPTVEQYQELITNCNSEWTTQKSVSGRLFTGSNGNSIFLPEAGYRYDTIFYNHQNYYWTSISKIYDGAYTIMFTPDYIGIHDLNRVDGLPIRPAQ